MSFKKTKVVMLPTNEKSNIVMNNVQQGLFVVGGDGILAKYRMGCTNQHLYFLSDEEIKEGDWGISKLNEIVQFKKNYESTLYKKIIATTDKSLSEQIMYYPNGAIIGGIESYKLLPQPSQSFIEKFVEEYNKGNVITEVLVEYETITKRYGSCSIGEGVTMNVEQLKVSKDNTITIRKVKDSWNRDEVEDKIRKGAYVLLNGSIGDFDKWIEENL